MLQWSQDMCEIMLGVFFSSFSFLCCYRLVVILPVSNALKSKLTGGRFQGAEVLTVCGEAQLTRWINFGWTSCFCFFGLSQPGS